MTKKKYRSWSGLGTEWLKINGQVYIHDIDMSFNAKEAAGVLGITISDLLDGLTYNNIRVRKTGDGSIHFTVKVTGR